MSPWKSLKRAQNATVATVHSDMMNSTMRNTRASARSVLGCRELTLAIRSIIGAASAKDTKLRPHRNTAKCVYSDNNI